MAKDFTELYASVYKGFITASIIVFAIGMSTNGKTSFGCYQVGYSIFGIAVMLILIKILNNILGRKDDSTSLGNTMISVLPFTIILAVVGFLLYFNTIYQTIIIDRHVSDGYYIFSNIIIALLLIQLCVIYSIIVSDNFNEKGISQVYSSIVLLLSILTAICANILYTILKYFSTDGFETQILKI